MRKFIDIITEAQFAPSMHEFLNDEVVDDILRTGNWVDHGSEIEQWWDTAGFEYVDNEEVAEMPYEEARKTPEFRRALWKVLKSMADQTDEFLCKGCKYDGLPPLTASTPLWRIIWVDKNWKPEIGMHTGVYWSVIPANRSRFAQKDYSTDNNTRCIAMKVDAGNVEIDWNKTARSRFSYDHGLEEHEIQLTKDSWVNDVMFWELEVSKGAYNMVGKNYNFIGTISKAFA